ncbi:hypothetical protein LJC47_05595 [Desulfosarcina sp. OttesenSCG-928-B08]|nr:hypothetical protein [Desulfosarcina sp. OttesenSCG-928-B08]
MAYIKKHWSLELQCCHSHDGDDGRIVFFPCLLLFSGLTRSGDDPRRVSDRIYGTLRFPPTHTWKLPKFIKRDQNRVCPAVTAVFSACLSNPYHPKGGLKFQTSVKKQMKDKELFKSYTMMELLDELDSIEIFQHPNRKARFSEVTKKQKDIFDAMEVQMPASLC